MTLAELDTPFERHRIIHYGRDGNKVVRHWYEMQHIIASLYKGREHTNEYGETVYDTFFLFAGGDSGLLYEHQMKHPEWYTPEKCLESLIRYGYAGIARIADIASNKHKNRLLIIHHPLSRLSNTMKGGDFGHLKK